MVADLRLWCNDDEEGMDTDIESNVDDSMEKGEMQCDINGVSVKNWDSDFIRVDIDQDADEEEYLVQLKDEENHIDHTYLWDIMKEGMQLNLLDCQVKQPVITPRLIVVEPDYLVDISSIATCFTDVSWNTFQSHYCACTCCLCDSCLFRSCYGGSRRGCSSW